MLNKVQIIGRLGGDPEVKRLESGVAVARMNVACTESYKDKDGNKQEITEWVNLQCWRSLAEIAEKYLKKGSKIYAEGKMQTRSYEKDGQTHKITEVVASNFIMLDSKESGGTGADTRPPAATSTAQAPYNARPTNNEPMPVDDDLPF